MSTTLLRRLEKLEADSDATPWMHLRGTPIAQWPQADLQSFVEAFYSDSPRLRAAFDTEMAALPIADLEQLIAWADAETARGEGVEA